MGKQLRATSKAALILLAAAAAGLVAYAYIGDRQRRAPATPSPPIKAPGTEPATARVPSAPETAPAGAEAGPTAPPAVPSPQEVQPDLQREIVGFKSVLRDREKDREQATVTGERALWNEKTKIFDLFAPLVTVYLVAAEDEGSEDQLEEV
ncbi:MAG: hypothetical protein KAX44_05840, partial [Candidatus Brocadiae bacterium]|nr:hypothetical protein [Candidatus Brocadiia bacterium]